MSAILRGNFRMALSGVKSSKWRSFLTMVGIITGIVAVVTVVGIGEGVKRQIAGTLNHFGKDLIIIRPAQATEAQAASLERGDVIFGLSSAVHLSGADADLVKRSDGVDLSAPLGVVPGVVEVEDKPVKNARVLGTGADIAVLLNQKITYGDFWTAEDESAHYAVLGQKAAYTLFDEPAPLGKSFTFRGESFQVRGVFEAFPKVPFSPTASFDDGVFIPYKTAATLTSNSAGPYVILARPDNPNRLSGAIGAIEDNLVRSHGGERDVSVLESRQSLEAGNGVIRLLSMWIFAVAAISLLMGGVGIMNIMLLVVTERMHEIGVRKAVGATSRQILGQFILEAAVLSVLGGIIGIAASTGAIGLLRLYTDLQPVISWTAIGIAAGVSVVIGVIFGAIPAIKAARKDPIEALRHE